MDIDLFLCHSSVDKPWVERLAADVEAEEWNDRHLTVFLDKWDIPGGENIILKLNDGLSRSRFVAVVMTPEMIGSDWCKAEWSSILHQDPTNRTGRILPIRLRDFHNKTKERIQVPPFLQSLAHFDFRDDKTYRKEFARLLAKLRGQAPPRGGGGGSRRRSGSRPVERIVPAVPRTRAEPDRVPETLLSNLLPVRAFPATVWSAPTAAQTKRDLPAGLPPCIVRGRELFTFANLSAPNHAFAKLVASEPINRIAALDWLQHPVRSRWYVELLNDTLRTYLATEDIDFDDAHKRFFFKAQGNVTRRLRWGAGSKRWVVRAPDPEKKGYWVHHAAHLRFERLDDRFALSIEPTMMFTTDGTTPVSKELAGPLAMKWTGKERNGAILRHVLMWSDALTRGKREALVPAGDQQLLVGRLPTTVPITVGLADDVVTVGALLVFTRSELDPAAPQHMFAYLEPSQETANDSDDDEDEDEASASP